MGSIVSLKRSLFFYSLILLWSGCKARKSTSEVLSGPGGSPAQWSCRSLKTEYDRNRADLLSMIQAFNVSKSQVKASANDAKQPVVATDTKNPQAATTAKTADLTSRLGAAPNGLPELPEPLKSFPDVQNDNPKFDAQKGVAECDDQYESLGMSTTNSILEQCRHVVRQYNLLAEILFEYNYAREGECRSGKAASQSQQITTIFPYCKNPCRFGQTFCVKCEFAPNSLQTSYYICGDELDGRQAVDAHCHEGNLSCSGSTAICGTPQAFNESVVGTTAGHESSERVDVNIDIVTTLKVEGVAGVEAGASTATKVGVGLVAEVLQKNERGAPIVTGNGGETASKYSCAIRVDAATIREVKASAGLGFDLVLVKGSATVGVEASFATIAEFRTTSPDIDASGQPMDNMTAGCRRFAFDWAQKELPQIVARNIKIVAVASSFMTAKKEQVVIPIPSQTIWCKTDRRSKLFSSKPIQYQLTKTSWALTEEDISMSYGYAGNWNIFSAYGAGPYKLTKDVLGPDLYARTRKMVFGSVYDEEAIMRAVEKAYASGGYLTSCKKGSW